MKRLFRFDNLPIFFQNSKLGTVAFLLLLSSAISVIFAVLLNFIFGFVWALVVIIALVYSTRALKEVNENTQEYLSGLTYRIYRSEQEALIKMPIGIILLDNKKRVDWVNPYMQEYFDRDVIGYRLDQVDKDLNLIFDDYQGNTKPSCIDWKDKKFSLYVEKNLHAIYLMDIDEYAKIAEEYKNHQLIMGMVSVDNYEEVIDTMNDSEASLLRAYITQELTTWSQKFDIYLRRVSSDRYIFFGYLEVLKAIEDDKFEMLKSFNETTAKQNTPVSLSMGVAYGESDLAKLADLAQTNLDLALGRGGDQVVVKSSNSTARFYGNASNPMEKRTRVRARMISQAISDLIEQVDDVFIVGHRNPDLDVIGGALGMWRLSQTKRKNAYIVLDEKLLQSEVHQLLEEAKKQDENSHGDAVLKNSIVSEANALKLIANKEKTLLILVDHSKLSISEAPNLITELENRIVIIDHHRRGEETLEKKPLLSYIEPYASSTSELVVELLQYQSSRKAPLNKIEATVLLSGIQLDTQNFTRATGYRTFDAASYLRSAGADTLLINSLMKEDLYDYNLRSELIYETKIDDKGNAISVANNEKIYPSVIAAQAADELLKIKNVKASFVIIRREDNKVAVSARSNGEVNVQLIMEQLGGGGHLTNAATQVENETTEEVEEKLIEILERDEEK